MQGTGSKEEFLERVEMYVTCCFDHGPVEKKRRRGEDAEVGMTSNDFRTDWLLSCDKLGVIVWGLERKKD